MKGKLKKLFVNHGEKIGMVVVALVVIIGLTKADWAPYNGTPGEITTKVKQNEGKWLEKKQWDPEEAKEFEIKPENEPKAIVAANIGNAMPLSEYSLTQKFVRSPYEQNKPLTNPEWKVLEEPIATPGRVLLAVVDEEARKEMENRMQGLDKDGKPLPAGSIPGAPKPGDENIPDEFRTRINPAVTGTQADTAGVGTLAMDPLANQGTPAKKGKKGAAATSAGSGSYDPFAAGGAEGSGMTGMPAAAGLPYGQKGRGFHYASIRAVFPVRDQINKIVDATNLPHQQAAMSLVILDYRIERQTKQESGDPWSGPWEPVDVNVSADVLTKMSVGLEPDVVYPQLTDPAMTMPLPARISGIWKNDVTHPKIEKFTLTDEQIQQEVKFQQEMLRKLEEMQKELPPPPAQKAGWTGLVINGSQLQNVMMGGDGSAGFGGPGMGMGGGFAMPGAPAMPGGAMGESSGAYGSGAGGFGGYGATAGIPGGNKPQAKLKPIEELLKMDEKKLGKELKQYIEKAVNVVGELLLFRYIDFSVEPGKTYRYRARLVFKNPNFNLDADRAAGDTSVVTGETRMSDWSAPTVAVTIPKDQQSYVTDVKPAAGSNVYPTPQLNVFQWDPNLGSVQQAVLTLHLGQTISGKARTDVLDPAKASFEKKEYTFQSSDYIVDAQPDVQLEALAHPDVKATGGTNHLGLPEQVLVALSEGGVSILDPSVTKQAEQNSAKYLNLQNETWKKMKEQASAVTDAAGMEGSAGEGMYDSAMTYGLRGASPLSTKNKKTRRGPAMPMNN